MLKTMDQSDTFLVLQFCTFHELSETPSGLNTVYCIAISYYSYKIFIAQEEFSYRSYSLLSSSVALSQIF